MSRFRKIDTRIWNDKKFRALSDRGKVAFFLLLTHPHMTSLGAMRGTLAGLAEELGWTPEAFREAFREALSKGMAEHDSEACLIALPNFLRYNAPESPNVIKAWVGALDLLPECPLKIRVIARAKAFVEGLTEGFQKAFAEGFGKTSPYQEQEQEPEQEGLLPLPPSTDAQICSLKVTRRRSSPKAPAEVPGLYPQEVTEAVNGIASLVPLQDPQGRKIKTDAAKLAHRLQACFQGHPSLTAEIAVQSWKDYLATKPEWIKAPHYFFGILENQRGGEGAHWHAYAAMIWHKAAKAQAQAQASTNPTPRPLVEVGS